MARGTRCRNARRRNTPAIGRLGWDPLSGLLLSVTAMLLGELSFHLYIRPRQLVALFAAALIENVGYRQLSAWWRLKGLMIRATRRKSGWGTMT